MRKVVFMFCMVALVAMIAVAGTPEKVKPGKANATKSAVAAKAGTGTAPEAVLGTAWIQYDDNTAESDGNSEGWTSGNAVGNVFVPPPAWGTFYCDQISIYHASVNNNFSVSWFAGLNAGGTALTGNSYASFAAAASGNGVWNLITAATGWLGNASANWNAATGNAYLAGYQTNFDNIGVDTSAGSHGFGVTTYTGAGYSGTNWNAMLRARFNGATVPVELIDFSVE